VPNEVQCGHYYRSDHQLFCVEDTYGEHVLIEDCASGELLDIQASNLRRLIPVSPLHTEADHESGDVSDAVRAQNV
jgi:hypothetical protein